MKHGQELKLGDVPWTPQEISKKYKRQSLGMPKASPLHQQKAPGHFSTRYIFIPSCDMCYPWSVFNFCCVFTFNKVGSHHSCLLWSETRSAVLHVYFGVRHAPLLCILRWRETRSTFTFIWVSIALWTFTCFSYMRVVWFHLVGVGSMKKVLCVCDANGSIFRLWHSYFCISC